MHEVLVNRLGGLSLPRKSVVRLTDRPDMTSDVYRGRKTTIQQQQIPSDMLPASTYSNTGINPIALRKAKIVYNFGLSVCIRVNIYKRCVIILPLF